ncbi:glycosyltransferase family 25 protein [Rhizobium sp. CFBP 8762]|uniref:glycosyltransferase family 25 protein n=1 Tax=Rhizobium sp. CFBP 8762 TaxID=2775279 RepID=UPI001783CFF8|nr:glycosyltransferase family 25 protein [Rhizobium sp. CFBP 8762]MBD8554955.1 glycosyltransferase family 25 protein [Rhizobium sp. CFBP 8762]
MKNLLINLDRCPDRLTRMDRVFAEVGLTYERICAIDGKAMSDAEYQHYAPQSNGKPRLSKSEVACYLSHISAWKTLLASSEAAVAVFEDDIHLSPATKSVLSNSDRFARDADLIKLETVSTRLILGRERVDIVPGYATHRLHSSHNGTGGYIVTRKGAERLLAASHSMQAPVDLVMYDTQYPVFQSLTVYQLTPAICIQDQILDRSDPRRLHIDSVIDIQEPRVQIKQFQGWHKVTRELLRPLMKGMQAVALKRENKLLQKVPFG